MSGSDRTLAGLRQRIDAIDAEMLDLLSERARLALELGRIKSQEGRPIYDPEREAALLKKIEGLNAGPLDADAVRSIFEEVLIRTRELQMTQVEKFSGGSDGAAK